MSNLASTSHIFFKLFALLFCFCLVHLLCRNADNFLVHSKDLKNRITLLTVSPITSNSFPKICVIR